MHYAMMRKGSRAALTFLAATGLVIVAGCSASGEEVEVVAPEPTTTEEETATSDETYTFEFTMHTGETDTVSLVNQKFIDEVAALSDGRITINPYFGGSLFGPADSFAAIEAGTADIGLQTSSFASGAIPDLAVLEVPYGSPAEPETVREFHQEVAPILDEIYQTKNQKVLFSNPGIFPGTILCNSEVPSGVDFTGKLIRTAGPWQGAVIESWGGTPVTLGVAELYAALQTGTVDCALQVYNLVDSLKLAEVAPYIYRLDFGANFNTINMNLDAWNSMNEVDQQIMLDAGAVAQDYAIELLKSEGQGIMDSIVASGGIFCLPSDEVILDKVEKALTVRPAMVEVTTTEAGKRLIEVSDSYQDRIIFAPSYGPTDPCS